MRIPPSIRYCLAGGLLCASQAAQAQVVYQNTFTGKSPVSLAGQAPDVESGLAGGSSSTAWNLTSANGAAQLANGAATNISCSSLLPFTPQAGYYYRVIASLTLPANSGNWLGIGFSPTDPSGSGGRLNDLGSPCWELASTATSGNEQSLGSGGTGTLFSSNIITAAGTYALEIDLDARGATWTATYLMKGAQVGGVYTFNSPPTIAAVGLTDNGVSAGSIWNSFEVDATTDFPLITTQPVGLTVSTGHAAQLSAQAWGGPATAGYQWQTGANGSGVFSNTVDGASYSGSGTATLNLKSVLNGAVDYRLIVTNSYGAVTSSVVTVTGVNIAAGLVSDIAPNPLTEPAGYNFSLSAGIDTNSSLPLTYVWTLDGVALTDGGRISGSQTAALTVAAAQAGDAGTYQLTVSNSFGPVQTSPDVVTIAPSFGFYDGSAWSVNGTANFPATDMLQLTSDSESAQAGSAYFNDLISVKNFAISFTQTADLPGGDGGFAFVLQTKGTNALGGTGANLGYSGVSKSVALEFNCAVAPAKMALVVNGAIGPFGSTGSVDAQSGDPITATLLFSGDALAVTLTQDGNTFTTNYTIDIVGTLGTNLAYLGFSGGIALFGTQHIISDVSYGPITGAPQVVGDVPATLSRPTGAMLRLQPTVDGSAPISFQWQHNGANINGATNEMLVLAHTQAGDAGSYQLIATNSAGLTNTSVCVVSLYSPVTLLPDGQVIYYNDFNVKQYWNGTSITNGGTIDATMPDIANTLGGGSSGAYWFNTFDSNGLAANGTIGREEQNSTLVPVTVQAGWFYKMSASISFPANSGNWIGMGFCTNRPIDTLSAAARMSDAMVGGEPWMLGNTVSSGNEQFFAGPNTANQKGSFNVFPVGVATNVTFEIDLDTTGAAWVATWWIGGVQITNFTYAVNPTGIVAAGLTMNTATNFVINTWELEGAQRVVASAPVLSSNPVVVKDTNGNPTSVVISGSVAGSGTGTAGWGFHLLSTTNIALPFSQWVSTPGTLDINSQFSVTNTVAAGARQSFYAIKIP